jgi:hypothetical protein
MHTAAAMRARFAGSVGGRVLSVAGRAAVLAACGLLAMGCASPRPSTIGPGPLSAGETFGQPATATPPAPRLTYNPAQWPNPLDAEWLGGTWALVAAVPGPDQEPVRYFLDFGREVLVTDEGGEPITWAGGLESVEWSDPRGTWTVKLDAPAPCGKATYSVTIKGGLLFIPIEESCRERFGILVRDAWNRPVPPPT